MKSGEMLIYIIIGLVIDLIAFVNINDWSSEIVYSMTGINIYIVIGTIFLLISPKGTNDNIFTSSTFVLTFIYLISEIALVGVLILFNVKGVAVPLTQAVLCIYAVICLILNTQNNYASREHDRRIESGIKTIHQIQDIFNDSMKILPCGDARVSVENAYDEVSCITNHGIEESESFDQNLYNIACSVYESAKAGDEEAVIQHCGEFTKVIGNRAKCLRRR